MFGYVCGSILFAPFLAEKFYHVDLYTESQDGNPGTVNAFLKYGFFCGVAALLGDIGKGILPVVLYLQGSEVNAGLILAFFYILYSMFIINPHGKRTIYAYLSASLSMVFLLKEKIVVAAMWMISFVVVHKHRINKQKEKGLQDEKARSI